jgi:hypothetical protein
MEVGEREGCLKRVGKRGDTREKTKRNDSGKMEGKNVKNYAKGEACDLCRHIVSNPTREENCHWGGG